MTQRAFDPNRLELSAFAHQGAVLTGEWPQARFGRLSPTLEPVADGPPAVRWSVRGGQQSSASGAPEATLQLSVQTTVALQCQRCLQPLLHPLVIERAFRFARDEDEAARLDEEVDDDVLVLVKHLDLADLIEDEIILSLPLVPRHESCPQPLLTQEAQAHDAEPAPHPFAALAALRRPPTA